MKIFGVQFDIAWENRDANYDSVRSLLADAGIPAGSLIVLPELFATGFSMNIDATAEEDPSQSEAFLAEIASQHRSHSIGGLATRGASDKGRNELAVFSPDGRKIARYQKNYTFSYTRESQHYENGSEIALFKCGGFQVCPLICYDLRFPELFRRGIREGAMLFPVIASWPEPRIDHWDTLLRARAIENQAAVIGVNRVGDDPNNHYPGHSQIINHHGTVVSHLTDTEGVISADLDGDALLQWRRDFPALDDIKD